MAAMSVSSSAIPRKCLFRMDNSPASFPSRCCTMCPRPYCRIWLFAQVWRVLEPGGVFVGSDSRQSWQMRMIHIGDTLIPIDPDTVSARLEVAGFEVLEIEKEAPSISAFTRDGR